WGSVVQNEVRKQLIPKSSRQFVVEKNQTSSLVITEVALEDSGWYYCEVNVLQKDPEWGNGTELLILAPPSAPKIYLQIPPDPQTGQWALFCLTGDTTPASSPSPGPTRAQQPILITCQSPIAPFLRSTLMVMDSNSQEVFLFSVFFLPHRESLETGITFTCGVQDHPAMTTALTASFTWDAYPNELIAHLNIVKLCFLSAMTVVFLLEAIKHFCVQGE
ncbi:uncharacterized protein LOC116674963, partial [Etheostoma spectabile]|uniref:uncharacterized protein LOC116674963 n=1 Tax=Etheostoma spectabile TaxID=54343 RepID=UPI0013AE9AB7